MYRTSQIALPPEALAVLNEAAAGATADDQKGVGGMFRRMVSSESKAAAEDAALAKAVLAAGTCEEVIVQHDVPPAVLSTEDGFLVFVQVDPNTTLMLDVVEDEDDPRWRLHQQGGFLLQNWRWLRLGDFGSDCFTATGAPVAPVDLGPLKGTALEAYLDKELGWPEDDSLLELAPAKLAELSRQKVA